MPLIDRLPPVRGRLQPGAPLAPLTWLRVGGPAEVLFQPADAEDLAEFLGQCPPDVPVTPLGVCSNLIIRDGGLPGVAIRLGRGFSAIETLDGHRLRAGAAALDAHVAKKAAEVGIAGLEFLRTIPGAIGGAVRMNAGCYGSYAADVVAEVEAIDRAGNRLVLTPEQIGFGYRSSTLPADTVIVAATLQGRPGDAAEIAARMEGFVAKREESQPLKTRSCGSTFANPAGYSSTGEAGDPMDLKAWKLIEQAGCRGLRLGGAAISEKHCNFLINTGDATAADLEGLGELVRARVKSQSGIDLRWEIQRIGVTLVESETA
ncbi:MAG TPA: UDP-N-acetylmuramate dehydrogenase [Thermohalobaculum sp.]|nr:UDP-N-acetylmuramate dehydrogenase [Thermohalobaculum sp.]